MNDKNECISLSVYWTLVHLLVQHTEWSVLLCSHLFHTAWGRPICLPMGGVEGERHTERRDLMVNTLLAGRPFWELEAWCLQVWLFTFNSCSSWASSRTFFLSVVWWWSCQFKDDGESFCESIYRRSWVRCTSTHGNCKPELLRTEVEITMWCCFCAPNCTNTKVMGGEYWFNEEWEGLSGSVINRFTSICLSTPNISNMNDRAITCLAQSVMLLYKRQDHKNQTSFESELSHTTNRIQQHFVVR